jgi:radical SAM superfamily enzyme
MYEEYMDDVNRGTGEFHIMTMEEYTDIVAGAIALLPKETVVHRMTGDGPRKLLVEPLWSLDKKRVLNMLTAKTKGLLT